MPPLVALTTLASTAVAHPTSVLVAPDAGAMSEVPVVFEAYPGNPVLTPADVTDVHGAMLVADPFLFRHRDQWLMFVEVWGAVDRHGDIAVARSPDGLHWTYEQVVLDEPFHLSYPQVFQEGDDHYMVPESWQTGSVRLYRAPDFPYHWVLEEVLVSGRELVDPSIVRYHDRWWMFVGGRDNQTTWLNSAEHLRGPWTEHPASPIVTGDATRARPGGRVLAVNGGRQLVRAVQDDDPYYGEGVHWFEVTALDEETWTEAERPLPPGWGPTGDGWAAGGMHHVDPWPLRDHWLVAVDGQSQARGDWSVGIQVAHGPGTPDARILRPADGPVRVLVGTPLELVGQGLDPGGQAIVGHRWQFGERSGLPELTGARGSVVFEHPGRFELTYEVTNAQGLTDPLPDRRMVEVVEPLRFLPVRRVRASGGQADPRYPPRALVEGPGHGFDAAWPHQATAEGSWSTASVGAGIDHFERHPGPVQLELELEGPGTVTGLALWTTPHAPGNRPRTVSVRLSPTGDPADLGRAWVFSCEEAQSGELFALPLPDTEASLIRVALLDNRFGPDVVGGDRVGLQELAVTGLARPPVRLEGARVCSTTRPAASWWGSMLVLALLGRRRSQRGRTYA